MSKMNLTEATMLALQGKLPMRESKATRKPRNIKKTEAIDVNVDDKTNVSVLDNETIVDTEEATIIVDKKQDSFVPETNDIIEPNPELPVDSVEVPIEGDETIIPEDIVSDTEETDLPLDNSDTNIETSEDDDEDEIDESKKITESQEEVDKGRVPEEAYSIAGYIRGVISDKTTLTMDEFNEIFEKAKSIFLPRKNFKDDDLESEVRGILSQHGWATIFEGDNEGGITTESKKVESVEIEVSDDGKEVEVKTDNGEEVEVKDETPEEETIETDVEEIEPTENEEIEESKKLQEDISAAPFRDLMYDCLRDDVEPADVMVERMLSAWSDDDCKWYCETYELVTAHNDFKDEEHYYEDVFGNIRDITGQVVDDDNLEETKHRKVRSAKALEERKNKSKNCDKECCVDIDEKTFNEALVKHLKVETVENAKITENNGKILLKAKVVNENKARGICFEMNKISENKNFVRYSLVEQKSMKTENKTNQPNITLLAYNKNNKLECRYIIKK